MQLSAASPCGEKIIIERVSGLKVLLSTGQTRCYDENGAKIPCTNSGQDGEYGSGSSPTSNRFEILESTVIDKLTGLEWVKDAGIAEFPLTWTEALDFTREMNLNAALGRADWKLPNRQDLFSLVSHTEINPALDEDHPFINVFSGYYWTSTTCARLPDQAWYIHLGGARVHRGMKYGSYMVWPVRFSKDFNKKQIHPAPPKSINFPNVPKNDVSGEVSQKKPKCFRERFVEENNSVYDRLTGLSWTRSANLAKAPVDWKGALETIARVNTGLLPGTPPWRLPNVRELESLVDLNQHSPALPKDHPFSDAQLFYWSSTTSVYEPRYAWVLYLQDGSVGVGFKKKSEFFVWAVHD